MLKHKKYLFISFFFIILIISFGIYFFVEYQNTLLDKTYNTLKTISSIEQAYIQKLPTYDDFITKNKQNKLRQFLLQDHLNIAKKYKMNMIKTDHDLQEAITSKKIVYIDVYKNSYKFYFYNVPKKNRHFTPKTLEGLLYLTEQFNIKLKEKIHKDLPDIKIAISSALRTSRYQKKLTTTNANAAIKSSHSYGISFDVFYDDFIVDLLPLKTNNILSSDKVHNLYLNKFKFLLGDALRRQFHSILVETLLELQGKKVLYAIWEKKQKCYHITIL